ncbi:STAS domain-containing protein [Acidimangrovimonas sediminis]|uniref:STAS domain-containing protein n=1 Tax=Acidimangrovimonas sediminis TaxID=2056283 RepID=UPI000C807D09|nr:STAS domain-containing protein [Acidimangrovimonas sediminis]
MKLRTELRGTALVIRVEERRIDAAVAIRFKDLMRDLVEARADRIILDLGQVEFLDSSGLGAVVAVRKMLSPGRQLELAAMTPTVARVLALTRMDSVFPLHAQIPDLPGPTAHHAG